MGQDLSYTINGHACETEWNYPGKLKTNIFYILASSLSCVYLRETQAYVHQDTWGENVHKSNAYHSQRSFNPRMNKLNAVQSQKRLQQ